MTCSAPIIASASRPRSAARSRRSTRFAPRSKATSGSASSNCSAGAAARPPCSPASSPRSTARSSPRCPPISTCCCPCSPRTRRRNPAHYAMCVISEGARIAGEDEAMATSPSPAAERDDGGVGHRLGRAVKARLGVGIVLQELAYLMRSGEPDAMDRMVGFAFGGLAVQLLERGEKARMVTLVRRQLQPRPDRHPAQGQQVGRRQRALRQSELSRPADAGRGHADVPLLKARRPALLEAPLLPARGLLGRITCGRGGTGRRAALRSLWPKGRGSSSLLDRTI